MLKTHLVVFVVKETGRRVIFIQLFYHLFKFQLFND
jgi:hypothetical protein